MNRWSLIGAAALMAGCGLFRVNVNGEVRTSGGGSSSESGSKGSKSKSGDAKNDGDDGDGGKKAGSGEKADKQKAEELRKDAKAIRNDIDKAVQETTTALPADKISQLDGKRKEFASAGLAAEARYLEHLMTYYKIENGWRAEGAKSAEAVAAGHGGSAVTSGEVTGKDKMQVFKFQAKEGHCYTVALRMKIAGGNDDRMSDFYMDGGKENSSLQRYHFDARRTRGSGFNKALAKTYTYGACALKATEVAVSVQMTYAGSTNGLRYVVVETPREKLSQYVALDLEPQKNDSCDVDNWASLWLNPIPGSVLYGKEEPFIPFDIGNSEDMWTTSYAANLAEVRIKREDFTSTPPKTFKFEGKPKFKGCPKELKYAHSADGIKIATCYEKLAKRYDPQFDAARKARDNALGIVAVVAANKRLDALQDQYDGEVERTCGKMEDDIEKKYEAAYSKIVDFYNSTPVKSSYDRGKDLKLTYEGAVEIGCQGMSTCSL